MKMEREGRGRVEKEKVRKKKNHTYRDSISEATGLVVGLWSVMEDLCGSGGPCLVK